MNIFEGKELVVSGLILLAQICVSSLVIYGTAIACFAIVKRLENTEWIQSGARMAVCIVYSAAVACCIRATSGTAMERFLLCVVAGCLLFAGMTDVLSSEVYRFTWWIAGTICIVFWLYRGEYGQGLPFLGFFLMQELLFGRLYGRADCHAFSICASLGGALGWDMTLFFLHMTVAFIMLCMVQAFRRNIGSKGRLKQQVPFLPYIIISFWLLMVLCIKADSVAFKCIFMQRVLHLL